MKASPIELLAPAGSPEKLDFALRYGADAVYLSDPRYGLRAGAGNFSVDEIREASRKVHAAGKRIYVAVNIFAHEDDLEGLPEYLSQLNETGVDALIVTDPGVIYLSRRYAPDIPLHLSTQANTLNSAAACFWRDCGVSRIVLARELTLEDIRRIHATVPDIPLEVFVHGSVCIAYAGRCFISNYMVGRDANRGECANSCRWNYALQEAKRPEEYYPVEEDARGTYFFNAKDLNMLAAIPRLIGAGVTALKIEGRGKSIHYLASTVATYRAAIDAYLISPEAYAVNDDWFEELRKIPNRGYTTGFLDGAPSAADGYSPDRQKRDPGYRLVGIVRERNPALGIRLQVKNKILSGDELECLSPEGVRRVVLDSLFDQDGRPVEVLKPGFTGYLPADLGLNELDILRQRVI